MKRTCNGCITLVVDSMPLYKCELGFKVDSKEGKPLEECPKPKTISDFVVLKSK